jgi:hypothetical protein
MRIARWIPKATDTHSEYVMLIAFPLQQWFHEMLRCTFIVCEVTFSFRPAFRPRDANMYLILDYVQKLHGVATLPWTSFISLFKSQLMPSGNL